MAQTAGAAPNKRLVIFMCNNGVKRCNFWPTPPSASMGVYPIAASAATAPPILNALFTSDGKTDNGLMAKTNIFRGLTVNNTASTSGNQHDAGFARMFTGTQLSPTPDGKPWGGGISIDQVLANDWNVKSLTTAVLASQVQPGPKPGFNHRLSFSYVAPQRLNAPIVDPITAYTQTFPQTGNPAAERRLALRQSVLDSVAGDLQDLQGRLGPDDNHKLDFHLTAVRNAENQLSNLLQNHGACAVMQPQDFNALPPGLKNNEVNLETYVPNMVDAFAVMIGAAIKCGLTRVASLQYGYGGGKWACGWLKINVNHHDSIAHRDTADGPANAQITTWVTTINQYYASVVQKVCLDLASAHEGNGTILDNTLVIWANELGRGDHQLTDMPIVFVGLVGNGIKQGNRLIDVSVMKGGQQPFNIHGYHALNALGHTTAGWGDIPDMSSHAIPSF
jgi:hypothetical protein